MKEESSDSALAREVAGVFFGVTTGMVGLLVLLLVWLVVVGVATLVFAIPVLLTLDLLPAEVLVMTFLAVAFAGTAFFTPLAGVGLALAFLVAGIVTLLPELSSFLYQNPLVDARNVCARRRGGVWSRDTMCPARRQWAGAAILLAFWPFVRYMGAFMSMQLQALIFDVDGTLADTELHGHRVAFYCSFARAGLDWEWSVELYGKLLKVTGGKERIRRYLDEYLPVFVVPGDRDAFITGLHRAKNALYAEMVAAGDVPLRFGVFCLLCVVCVVGLCF